MGGRGDVIAGAWAGGFDGVDQLGGHGRGGEFPVILFLRRFVEPVAEGFVFGAAGGVFPVDPLFEMRDGVLADAGADGAGFDEDDVDARSGHFEAEDIGKTLQREFGGDIGAAPFRADEAEDGGALHDAAVALPAEGGDQAAGQVVVAEEVGFEDLAQGAAGQVFHRAGAGEGAVVEDGVQRAAGAGQRFVHCGSDAVF